MFVSLLKLSLVFSLLATPSIIIFFSTNGLEGYMDKVTNWTKMTLANMGYSTAECSRNPIIKKNNNAYSAININC